MSTAWVVGSRRVDRGFGYTTRGDLVTGTCAVMITVSYRCCDIRSVLRINVVLPPASGKASVMFGCHGWRISRGSETIDTTLVLQSPVNGNIVAEHSSCLLYDARLIPVHKIQ